MEGSFPIGLLEALVGLDDQIIKLEKASVDEPDEAKQVLLVQDILQGAGDVIAQFRDVWAVYEGMEAEPSEQMELDLPTIEDADKKIESGRGCSRDDK